MKNIYRVILALTLLIMVACSWIAPMDSFATERVDAGLKRALISFATARALNAVISVVQGTEVAVEPMGVGVSLSLGQVLDPINDLVEQFSSLMLVASVALGIQRVLISIGGYWPISLLMTLGTIAWAWQYFRHQQLPVWLSKVVLILFMIRFTMPIVTVGSDVLFQKFLADDFNASQLVLNTAPRQVSALNLLETQKVSVPEAPSVQVEPQSVGVFSAIENALKTTVNGAVNVVANAVHVVASPREFYDQQLKKISETTHTWIEHIIKLIVVFLLQTLIIPVLLAWVLYAVARGTFDRPTLKRTLESAN
jgi:hypothetical protein